MQEFEHETPLILATADGRAGEVFFTRVAAAIASVEPLYDVVVIDCPPQLGFLTLGALCAATGVIVTVHPQMLDVASMSQFLLMTADLLQVVDKAGGNFQLDFLRYLITRFEPQDGPQAQVAGFLRNLFGPRVLTNAMLKTTLVSDAGLTKQTLYEIPKQGVGPHHLRSRDRGIEQRECRDRGAAPVDLGPHPVKRRDLVQNLLAAEPQPFDQAAIDAKARVPSGAVRAIGLELSRLGNAAHEASRLREQLHTGNAVLDLDPSLVSSSFVSDRLSRNEDPDYRKLVESIRESGQQVPILVRPHPEQRDGFQVAFGHRRRDAARELGIAVRAIVRPLSDQELIVAQGKEKCRASQP